MKRIISLVALAATFTLLSCSTPDPQVENCKIGCESRARHSSDFVENCKRMCEKYRKN